MRFSCNIGDKVYSFGVNTSNTSPLPLPHSLCHFMHLHGCTFLIIYLVVSLSVYCLLWGAGNLCGWLHAVPFSLMHKNLSVNNKWAGLQFNCTPFPQTLLNHKCFLQQSNVSSYNTVTFYVNKSVGLRNVVYVVVFRWKAATLFLRQLFAARLLNLP